MANDDVLRALDRFDGKLDRLSDGVTEIKVDLAETKATMAAHLEADDKNLNQIIDQLTQNSVHLSEYNAQLGTHIQGVKEAQENNRILREQLEITKERHQMAIDLIQARIDEMGKPREWIKTTGSIVLTSGKFAGAIASIWLAFEAVKKWILPFIR